MSLTEEEKLEKIKDLRPIDAPFFEILLANRLVCQEVLRIILKDSNLIVKNVAVKEDRDRLGDCVRLDGLCLKDEEEAYFSILRSDTGNHLQRARFVMEDIVKSEAVMTDDSCIIPNIYIVYITEKDIFNGGRIVYEMILKDKKMRDIPDNRLHLIFVNAEIDDESNIAESMRC